MRSQSTKNLLSILTMVAVSLLTTGIAPLPAAAEQYFKGNLHTHTLWSDGNNYPEMVCDWYLSNGYQFLGLSDHNILSRGEKWVPEDQAEKRGAIDSLKLYRARFGDDWVETRDASGRLEVRLKTLDEFRSKFEQPGKFLLIESEEVTDRFGALPVHINATNLTELIRPRGGDSVRATMTNNLQAIEQQSRRAGRPILAHLNHPNYGFAITAEDMAAVVEEKFFEIYNGHPGVNQLGDDQHAAMERVWDIANSIRLGSMKQPPLLGLATDDSHNYFGNRDSSPGRGWVMVLARQLDSNQIVEAIQRGDFYASSGVTLRRIHYAPASNRLRIEIDEQAGVAYETRFIGTLAGTDLAGQPLLDGDGKELAATRVYSEQVGKVLATVSGGVAEYALTGDELYVRAVVVSSRDHPNPSLPDQKEQAWVQPVGWLKQLQSGE